VAGRPAFSLPSCGRARTPSAEGRPHSLDYLTHNWPQSCYTRRGFLGRKPRPRRRKVARLAYRCKSLSLVGESPTGAIAALPLYCRRWQCPDCGKFQRRRLQRRLLAGDPTTFITLTTNPNLFSTPDDAFKQASLAINRLIKVLRRRYPRKRIEYGLVWEKTKNGWPHAHLLVRAAYIPQKVLSREWERLSGAKVVDIRMVRSKGEAAAYVSKYLAKDPACPEGYRRYRLSQRYSAPPAKGSLADMLSVESWSISRAPLDASILNLNAHGYRMVEYWPELFISSQPRGP